eukprot:scaffold149_cov315-Pinguiococcus_pyrenoidosus.AAC.164
MNKAERRVHAFLVEKHGVAADGEGKGPICRLPPSGAALVGDKVSWRQSPGRSRVSHSAFAGAEGVAADVSVVGHKELRSLRNAGQGDEHHRRSDPQLVAVGDDDGESVVSEHCPSCVSEHVVQAQGAGASNSWETRLGWSMNGLRLPWKSLQIVSVRAISAASTGSAVCHASRSVRRPMYSENWHG